MPEIGAVDQESFALQETEIRSVAFSPNGLRLASAGRGGVVWCWDLATCRGTQLPSGGAGHVRSLAFSPDASTLATACADRIVELRSVPFGEMTGTLQGHEGGVYTVAYSPDGRMIASGGDDGTIKLWNSIDQTPIATLYGHDSTVRAVAFRPDGRRLTSGGDDGTIRFWSLVDHRLIGTLSRHDSEVRSVAFNPDGRRLASGGRDGSVRLWDPVKLTQLELLAQHEGWVFSVAFSPDGHSLACGCSDGTAWLYDLTKSNSSDTQRLKLIGHGGQVRSVAFSPDGQVLASGGDDRSVRLWEVSTGQQLLQHHPGPPLKQIPHHGVAVEDTPTAVDRLGFRHDVNALAAIIAAKDTTPPVSIAVAGRWGIGKTSFAKQLENTLDRLVAGVDDASEGTSSFVSSVCHVSFNAWHYSDEHIWVGIIDNLFQALSAYCAPQRSGANAHPRDVVEKIEKLTARLDEYRQEVHRIERLQRILGFAEDSDTHSDQARRDEQAEREDREQEVAADLNKLRFRNLWEAVRDTIQLRWPWLAAGILSAITGAAVAWAAHTAYGLLASLPLVGTIIAAIHTFAAKHRGTRDKWKTELDNEAATKKGEIERIERQLTLLEPVRALSNFLQQRAHAEAYGAHRGVMGMVHRDITELHAMLDRAEGMGKSGCVKGVPARIILYIDDIDRCSPERVIEVLAAINLLQKWPRFIVVAMIDPDLLVRTLREYHYPLFGHAGLDGHNPPNDIGAVTPQDYLDKIFQLSVQVRAAEPARLKSLMRSILGSAGTVPHGMLSQPASIDVSSGSAKSEENFVAGTIEAIEQPRQKQPADEVEAEGLALRATRALRLDKHEIEHIDNLVHLFQTPRSIKHMANLYKFIRVGVPDNELPRFLGEDDAGVPAEFPVAQVLLALLVSDPAIACDIFSDLHLKNDQSDVLTVIRGDRGHPRRVRIANLLNEYVPKIKDHELNTYRAWSRRIARYSLRSQLADLSGP